jgi:hypothetical protein
MKEVIKDDTVSADKLDSMFAATRDNEEEAAESVGQDDIDALFGAGSDADDDVSADDIDALFNQ